jgi:hypothetical protein
MNRPEHGNALLIPLALRPASEHGGLMNRWKGHLVLFFLIGAALPAAASDFTNVKCPAKQDHVSLYSSVTTLDVAAQLRCGETVEIVSRVKGYVKIRTAGGLEGYLPDSVLPALPPLDDENQMGKRNADSAPIGAASPQVKSVSAKAAPANSARVLPVSEPAALEPGKIAPGAPIASPPREIVAAKPAESVTEPEDYPETQPENESADPACRVFFSAYGLGATQFKWLAESRRKEFANICPAPTPASVDFVILFTHDSDSYNSALPTPVHMDGNGFSDFNPLMPVDPALMSLEDADKAHYELVWVFRVKRGAFDPEGFSPRRRPQFTNTSKGSGASARAVEDAFGFIEQQAPDR